MTIEEQINQCMIADQHWFRRKYKQASKLASPLREEKRQALILKINESILEREKRKDNIPNINYPDLPISAQKDEILKAILENQVVIVAGETGSGKTTQLPKICLQAGLGIGGLIGHTQPRRIAARTVAARIAFEFESPLGKHVGFKVRFSDKSQKDNYIKIMTDGILLSETQNDKFLSQYDCIIIDEAHERSLNIDFLLGYLKKLITKRKDLKVIITSATIDVKRFSEFFEDAPIIEVKGRSYPVETLYLDKDFHDESDDPILQVANAVKLACQRGPGDILIFQSGEKEIREVIELLTYQKMNNVELLPLFSRQSNAEQQKVFQRSNKRKIIVTTNVAETSLTVPNIRFVIDSGLARISRYNYRNKLQRLPIEAISQASADQRKGRCGRVGPGVCYRLYREEDYLTRTPFTEPEILRTNLAGVILKMLSLDFESIETFEFIEPPDSRYFKDGFTLLERLQAVDENKKITQIGRVLATIPIEPKLGRIIIAANTFGALNEILIITSALSIIDVRERPQGNQSEADLAHAKFAHQTSDFMSILNLWQFIIEHKNQLSHQKMRKLCKENYLSFLRVLEWIDVYQQLVQITAEHNFKLNQVPADYALIHKSLLVGFIDTIGVKEEKQEYTGARNVKFFIHPQSTLFKRAPSWILSSEIVHTSKTFARMNGAIETKWIEEVADSLLKKQYDEPHFEPKSGRVVAFERASLFGLEIYAKKKMNYEKVAPKEARKIFIEQALIQEQMKQSFAFYIKNKETVKRIIQSEDRIRKKLILFDDTKLLAFYESKIPFYVCSVPALEKYLQDKQQDFLEVKQSEILLNEISDNLNNLFPEKLVVKEQLFCLEYRFDLSSENDGATLIVPFELLQYIKDEDFSWVIPGLLEEKIDFLIRALPKKNRTQFVPIPEFAKKAKQNISPKQGTLTTALQKYLENEQGSALGVKLWEYIDYPWHLIVHFKVLDKQGNVVGQGDDLEKLYHQLKEHYLEIYSI
ncbi:MAG: ATP-dependent RNA helicase HrpA [Candidatus Berkiella sp.]